MKTMRILKDYDYHATRKYLVAYKAGTTVSRVPEAAVAALVEAGAGEVVGDEPDETEAVSEQPKPKRGAKK